MRKLIIALLFVVLVSSVAFAGKAGNFGITGTQFLATDPLLYYNQVYEYASLFYYFTDSLSGELGVGLGNWDPPMGDEHKYGLRVAGYWDLGGGKVHPRLGAELDFEYDNLEWYPIELKYTTALISFGVEAELVEWLTLALDARLFEYNSREIIGQGGDPDMAILPGYTFGLRWYII